jgi:hypothetical protein
VCFDPTRDDDPLQAVEYWLKQLRSGGTAASGKREVILVSGRTDRGTGRLTAAEIDTYCGRRGIGSHVATSARTGDGIPQLIERIRAALPFDGPPTVTTDVFKRVKEEVLRLKERTLDGPVVLSLADMREVIEASGVEQFSDNELSAAIDHLSKHGYVTRLRTSRGEPRVLLAPDLLNNLAASIVLEARRNPRDLGSLEEQRLLSGDDAFPELAALSADDRLVLLDAAVVLFLQHKICFRETDPLSGRVYLVFPELINQRAPVTEADEPYEDGAAYTVLGQTENVYASLVVLLGYTGTFSRTNHWRSHARYLVGADQVCGFRQQTLRDGEIEFSLYFGASATDPIRRLFQSLFESFLIRRELAVRRFEPVVCENGHRLNLAVVRERLSAGDEHAFCPRCGARMDLAGSIVELSRVHRDDPATTFETVTADLRADFEQVLYRFTTYVAREGIKAPDCFVSYAWGEPAHEQWVEKHLAADLAKAGVDVLLDRWDNSRIGSSVVRFVERVRAAGKVIVVGTPLYRTKYDNDRPTGGYVVAAEGDLIGVRLIRSESSKQSVLPVLLDGEAETSFPALLDGRVYADFREEAAYFRQLFEVLLALYEIPPRDATCQQLRDELALATPSGSAAP